MSMNTAQLSLVTIAALLALAACEKGKKSEDAAATPPAAAAPATTVPATATPPTMTTAPAATPAAAGATAPGARSPELRAKFKAAKEACAADLQKFCATSDKPFRCLKQNEAQLSPACNAARAAVKAARQADKAE